MATIGTGTQILLYGMGDKSNALNDTWLYDANTTIWTQKHPSTSPPARFSCALAPLYGNNQVILFGGRLSYPAPTIKFNDTWIYHLESNEWRLQNTTSSPSPRYDHAMASNSNGTGILLFGGFTDDIKLNDTWIYSTPNNTWRQIYSKDIPPARAFFSMATIYRDNKVLLFGGESNNGSINDTWIFDFNDEQWHQEYPKSAPSKRIDFSMDTFFHKNRILLFGGQSPGLTYGETWFFNVSDNNWIEYNLSHKPARCDFGLATSYITDQPILFGGGASFQVLSDTWVFNESCYRLTGEYNSKYYDTGGVFV